MAIPSKRVCVQAVRNVSRCHFYKPQYSAPTSILQHRNETPLPDLASIEAHQKNLQRRAYHRTCRNLAADLTTLSHVEEEVEEPVAEYLIDESEISSVGHSELEQHREIREMVRLAAWEMPLLSQLAKPFEPPDRTTQPLRWRYTTYMGESHPASRKVVVEFNIDDLTELNEKQREKLKKLAGPRFNPDTKLIRMNCESFETQAQNKRYLGDTIQKLITEAKDLENDSFEDIPLDVRHHKTKTRLRFPEEWKMTESRRAQLEEKRKALLLEEGKRVEKNKVVSGIAAIEAARQIQSQRIEEPVPVPVRQALGNKGPARKENPRLRR